MKRDWSDGYVADITYSHGYFHELAPSYLRYFLLANGYETSCDAAGYTYCELGYGQGVSANIHAAASPRGEFWGTDFNPSHAVNARSWGKQAGIKAQWLDLSFEAMMETPTPAFDFIVLHGVWSWVNPAVQQSLVEFIRRKLKPGGAVFISYNILPGWNSEKPLRDLLLHHMEHASPAGASTPARIRSALEYARNLRRHGSNFFTDNVRASQALDEMLRQDPAQLAHEYFNQTWCLTYFSEVERALQAASLDFACSIHISDVVGEVADRIANAAFIDPALGNTAREMSADFILNRRFRRDLFMRGALRLSPSEHLAAMASVQFVLMRPPEEVSMRIATPYGQMAMDESMVKPLLEFLDKRNGPVSLAKIHESTPYSQRPIDELIGVLSQLVVRRDASPVFADDLSHARHAHTQEINTAICRQAPVDNSLHYLASPVTGGGVEAGRYDRLFWLAWHEGARNAADLARLTSAHFTTDSQEVESLTGKAQLFLDRTLPLWTRLGIVDSRSARPRK